jgi:5-methylcytosine-specific restriction endonuclease McrA
MKNKEIERIKQTRLALYKRSKMRCEVCGSPLYNKKVEMAHVIPKRKSYLKKYGPEVIHHILNLKLVDSENCNNAVNIGYKSALVNEKLLEIYEALGTSEDDRKWERVEKETFFKKDAVYY